jgi:Ca2+-binding EF-hand superfamily protein
MDRPERLIQAFEAFDADNSGRVPTQAMVAVLTSLGNPLTADEIKEFVTDGDDNGFIDYRKFVNSVVFGS